MANEVSYSQHLLSNDAQFIGRTASILKDEGYSPVGEPADLMARKYAEDIAAQPGLAESYHAALIADPPVENPGASNEVITDAALLSAIAAVMMTVQPGRSD
jgi:hypothetical protein